jgi:hypothetical protein
MRKDEKDVIRELVFFIEVTLADNELSRLQEIVTLPVWKIRRDTLIAQAKSLLEGKADFHQEAARIAYEHIAGGK